VNDCGVCGGGVQPLMDMGEQPIANRFLTSAEMPEERFGMLVGQCDVCGLVQLIDQAPAAELLPRVGWIAYREPEEHLDELAAKLAKLPGMGPAASIGGVSFKDDTLLARLAGLGAGGTWRIEPEAELGISSVGAGVETVEDRLTVEAAEAVAAAHGPADMIIARHILEHCHGPRRLLEALSGMLSPDGYLVIEVPDCTRAFEHLDYTTLWEEHSAYFTGSTFRSAFAFAGFAPVWEARYPYPFEDSLVIAARRTAEAPPSPSSSELRPERERADRFAGRFADRRQAIRAALEQEVTAGGKVALFGAGHLACVYLDFFGLAEPASPSGEPLVSFVVDDDPNKVGLFMPGSRLPVRPSSALVDEGVTWCLLSLSPSAEEKVIGANPAFTSRGGRFSSIIPCSTHAF
jgi:hypothetical protein